MQNLINYENAEIIREATEEEIEKSNAAAERDGGVGAITVEIDGETITAYTA